MSHRKCAIDGLTEESLQRLIGRDILHISYENGGTMSA